MSVLSPYQKIIQAAERCEPLELDVVEVQTMARDEHIKFTCQRQCMDFAMGLPLATHAAEHVWIKDEGGLLYCQECKLPHAHWSGDWCK